MKKPIRIENPMDCCACGACKNVCPKDAITMKEDTAGFLFPSVDEALCIGCGRCADVCVFGMAHAGENPDCTVYAATSKSRDVRMDSSSGGIFTELSKAVLAKGGAVFGAAWTEQGTVAHVCAESEEALSKLRGSKYVQSSTELTFRAVKELLKDGRYVFYTGTPCQIAGLKAYLGKDEEKLLCADIVCHGVPSMKMLRDDLSFVAGKNAQNVSLVRFRDKQAGWGVKGSITAGDKKLKYNEGNSPYYFYFLKGEIYRESCYNCRFPSEGRQGDITLGDYWGIRSDVIARMGEVDADEGISCVLVNTEKGGQWLQEVQEGLYITQSDRKSVERRNHQLTEASKPLPEHESLLQGYIKDGYAAIRNHCRKHTKEHVIIAAKNVIPAKIKRAINEYLTKP